MKRWREFWGVATGYDWIEVLTSDGYTLGRTALMWSLVALVIVLTVRFIP